MLISEWKSEWNSPHYIFVFKIQVHSVAFVYDKHYCVFPGIVGAVLTSLLHYDQNP